MLLFWLMSIGSWVWVSYIWCECFVMKVCECFVMIVCECFVMIVCECFVTIVCKCFVMIVSSQIIAFLAYQLLTVPLRVDPLSPAPFSRLSHTALNIIIITECFRIALFSALDIIITECFRIALFSALEKTHCTHVVCDFEWVTASFKN